MSPEERSQSAQSCLHAACDCPAQDASSYCSESCRTQHLAGAASGPCHCGHSGCSGEHEA